MKYFHTSPDVYWEPEQNPAAKGLAHAPTSAYIVPETMLKVG